jgi:class 3 adenylate cyclase
MRRRTLSGCVPRVAISATQWRFGGHTRRVRGGLRPPPPFHTLPLCRSTSASRPNGRHPVRRLLPCLCGRVSQGVSWPQRRCAMTELPRETVTFLFTDIEGSTRLLHELGERYANVLADQRRLLREAFARHNGAARSTRKETASSSPSRMPARRSAPLPTPKRRLPATAGRRASRYACVWACTLASRASPTTITSGSTSTAVPAWRQPRTAAGAVAWNI